VAVVLQSAINSSRPRGKLQTMSHARAIAVPCPHCLARAGKPCRSRSRRACYPHKARIMSAYHVMEPPAVAPEPQTDAPSAHSAH